MNLLRQRFTNGTEGTLRQSFTGAGDKTTHILNCEADSIQIPCRRHSGQRAGKTRCEVVVCADWASDPIAITRKVPVYIHADDSVQCTRQDRTPSCVPRGNQSDSCGSALVSQ